MKHLKLVSILLAGFFLMAPLAFAQDPEGQVDYRKAKVYVVIKNDGSEFVGKILSRDAREIVIKDKNRGKVVIPKHEVRDIKEVEEGELDKDGEYVPESPFSTAYFLFPNGKPIKEGDGRIQWNWWGPDYQFKIADRFGAGFSTSWLGIPIIGNAKYSFDLGEKTDLGVVGILGTGSWASLNSILALPMTQLTIGDRRSNFSVGGGFGTLQGVNNNLSGARFLVTAGGMTKLSKKVSLVMEANYFPPRDARNRGAGLVIPGIRWDKGPERAVQVGFSGIYVEEEGVFPFPIPFLRWNWVL